MTDNEAAMLSYAARGWLTFPAPPDGSKKGCTSAEKSNGRRWGATTDATEIEKYFQQFPRANVGIATGEESGLFVVEADTPEGHDVDGIASLRRLEAEHAPLPDTLIAESPSGSLHYYFKWPTDCVIRSTRSKIGPGIDQRGDGGMVLCPPSLRPGVGEYRWLNKNEIADAPQWIIDLATADDHEAKATCADSEPPEHIRNGEPKGRGTANEKPDPDEVRAALAAIPGISSEQVWHECGCALHHEFGEDGFEHFETWSKTSEKYTDRGCRQKWDNCAKYTAYNIGTIYHHADEADPGWRARFRAKAKKPEPDNQKADTGSGLAIVRVADVEARQVNWLWKPRIARGKLTIIAGMPDVNKSTLTLDLTARVTKGGALPCGEGRVPLGSVILLTAEDDVADTVRPRLEVAGADLTRVHVITAIKASDGKGPRSFDLTQDIARLEEAIQEIGDVALIVIDPVSAYMGKPGKLDSYRSTDVRATLSPLQEMAARCGAAVIGIDHLNKSGGTQAMMRVLGSIAFVAAARAVYVVVRDDEDDERRLFLPAKNNLGKIRTGLAFRVIEKLAPEPVFDAYPAIKWEDEPVTMTADEALANKHDGRRSEGAEAAKVLIAEMLADKAVPKKEIDQRAEAQKITHRSLETAKKAMGIVSTKIGTAWWWSLPGREPPM